MLPSNRPRSSHTCIRICSPFRLPDARNTALRVSPRLYTSTAVLVLVIIARLGVVNVAAPQLSVELSRGSRMMTLNICRPLGQPNEGRRLAADTSIVFEPECRTLLTVVEPSDWPNSLWPLTSTCTAC